MAKLTYDGYKAEVALLNQCAHDYYIGIYSGITDEEFDLRLQAIREYELENPNYVISESPSQRIMGEPGKVMHKVKMLSLADIFSEDELLNWYGKKVKQLANLNRPTEASWVIEPKIDGLSVELIYSEGKLLMVSTRGDGTAGEDVTANCMNMDTVPLCIPYRGTLHVRGEMFIPNSKFDKLRDEFDSGAKNARNSAVGLLKRNDGADLCGKYLDLLVFNIQYIEGDLKLALKTHMDSKEFMSNHGFSVVGGFAVTGVNDIIDVVADIEQKRKTIPYRIDGAVIKMNDLTCRGELGDNGAVPSWAIAFKYPAVEHKTKVIDIKYQLGKTGKLTPVAILEPVDIDGSTVSRCTLHNKKRMQELDIRVGDLVTIHKSGDIIPKITAAERTEDSEPFSFATHCPVCNQPVEDQECVNSQCPQKIEVKIHHWASKGGVDIVGLGSGNIKVLISKKLLRTPNDYYTLKDKYQSLIRLPGMGPTKVKKILDAIDKTRKSSFKKLLMALCINSLGGSAAEKLVSQLPTWQEFTNASIEQLQSIAGAAAGRDIYEALQTDYYRGLIGKLMGIFPEYNG